MMKALLLAALLPSFLHAQDDHSAAWSVFMQQGGIYFTSDRVSMAGFGGGIGGQVVWEKCYLARADVSILWGNGNAVPTRLAFGLQRDGSWSPSVMGTVSLLWGQRTEILSETGQRPAIPVWAVGLLVAPLRFERAWGYASALELGYGLGPDHGRNLELYVLVIGAHW